MSIFEKTKKGIVLRVRVNPNSSSCAVSGIMDTADGGKLLKINLRVVPEKGKANKELIAFLSDCLKIPKSNINIISGETDRIKKISFDENPDLVLKKLNDWLGEMIDG